MPTIKFTVTEIEVLLHRLEFLTCADLDELFEDADGAADYAQFFVDAIKGGATALSVDSELAGMVLIDAIEGATVHEGAQEEADAGTITQYKVNAIMKALKTAAVKIELATSRELNVPC